jgi:prolyl oligopeptidase
MPCLVSSLLLVGGDAAASKSAGTEVAKNEHHMIYYHLIGTPAASDRKIFDAPENPLWTVGASVTDDGKGVY